MYSTLLALSLLPRMPPPKEQAAAHEYNEKNRNRAKKPDRKPDSTLVLKILTKKIQDTIRLLLTQVYS
jgi:hypothetical protein